MSLTMRNRRKPRPLTPADELARTAAHPKPQFKDTPEQQIDTRDLPFRKIHPDRDQGYKRWLRFRHCKVMGKIDKLTDQIHVCWNPEGRFLADPAHTGKAYSGALKRSDIPSEFSSGCFSLCRHAHRQQEPNMDEFDRRFGINRHELAAEQHAEYLAEKERGR